MKFSINKSELQNALAIVSKGVSVRSTLPVLSGILVTVDEDRMTLQSTDLELSVQYTAPALVEERGRTVVPGKLFSDIVKSLPDAAVRISAAEGAADAQISCDTSTFSVKTLAAEDFPGFPTVSPSQTLELPFETFSQMVRRVSKVVSRDETRAILTGILVEKEGATLRMVATDSYRLAMTEVQMGDAAGAPEAGAANAGAGADSSAAAPAADSADVADSAAATAPTDSAAPADAAATPTSATPDDNSFSAVIGGSFLSDVASLSAAGEAITIGLSENQIIIACGDTTFINRRIEGQYPNYRQLLPDDHTTRATFAVDALSAAVKRASLMSSSTAPIKFNLTPDPVNLAAITVNSADLGSVRENIDCHIDGEEVEIAFNSSYVSEGLAAMRTDEVYFDVQSPLKPGIFHTIDSAEYLYLIMPVRI